MKKACMCVVYVPSAAQTCLPLSVTCSNVTSRSVNVVDSHAAHNEGSTRKHRGGERGASRLTCHMSEASSIERSIAGCHVAQVQNTVCDVIRSWCAVLVMQLVC